MKNKNVFSGGRSPGRVVGILLSVAGLALVGAGAILLDGRMNDRAVSTDTTQVKESQQDTVRGTLTLANTVYNYYHNYENYLFIGTDGSGNEDGEGEAFQNSLADYLMVLSIDKTSNTYTLIGLDPETQTAVDVLNESGSYVESQQLPLGQANWYGTSKSQGGENQVKAVSNLLGGLTISGYVSLSIEDLASLNQLVDGVTLTLEADYSKSDKAMKAGEELQLTDEQAYLYLVESPDKGTDTSADRLTRRQQYLTAFLQQGIGKVSSSPTFFYTLIDNMQEITTSNLTLGQFTRIADALTDKEQMDILSIDKDTAEDITALTAVLTDIYGLVADHEIAEEIFTEASDTDESQDSGAEVSGQDAAASDTSGQTAASGNAADSAAATNTGDQGTSTADTSSSNAAASEGADTEAEPETQTEAQLQILREYAGW